ncbi:MAG: DUF3187 family protein [Gammaproteobacteria bacterium]|nr:DUF3187 family protein [Gammaproteobacteria bacterium]
MRNHAPFAALIGVPGRWPDTTDHFIDLTWNASSHSAAERGDDFRVVTDGETHTLTGRLQWPIGERFRIGAELSWIQHTGGFMDGIIDTWHDAFGLNEGIRPLLEQDQLLYVLQRNNVDLARIDDDVSGIGDMTVGLSAELGSFQRRAKPGTTSGYFQRIPWRATFNVKLPTGDIDKLSGSGKTDVAVGLGWRSPPKTGAVFRWWADAGLVFSGGIDIDALDSSSQVYYYDTALTWRIVRSFDVIVQFAGHSSLYDESWEILGEASGQVAIGGLWHVTRSFSLRFGFTEDVLAESAPDFGIEVSLIARRW